MTTYIKTLNKSIKIGLMGILLFLSSCEKILEVDMPGNQINSDQVFENSQTANAALSGLYAGLYDSSPLAGDELGRVLSVYTDDLDLYQATSNTGIIEVFQNTLLDSNPLVNTFWVNAYQKVYMCNAILEGVENSQTLAPVDKQRIKGEALAIRSLLFFYLQQVYGDIPCPVTTSYMVNQELAKLSSNEVLGNIEGDLNQAALLLSDSYRSTERIFLNKKAVQLILAKVLMSQKKWGDATAILTEIKNSPLYQFQNDITKVFEKSGTHILWQLKPKNPGEVVKQASTYYFANAAPNFVAMSTALINVFDNNDKRKMNWTTAVTVGANTWYRASKYKNISNNATEYSIVLRLEEVYLLLAESMAQQGNINEALPLVNAIKQRSEIAELNQPVAKESLLNEILLENRREFFTETGHRFMDLKRNDKLHLLKVAKPNWKDSYRVWPIPQKEVLLNTNLLPQNEGY